MDYLNMLFLFFRQNFSKMKSSAGFYFCKITA